MDILVLLTTSLVSDSCEIVSQESKEESGQTRINVFCLIKLKQEQTVRRIITASKKGNKAMKMNRAGGYSLEVEHLPGKHKPLTSNPITTTSTCNK